MFDFLNESFFQKIQHKILHKGILFGVTIGNVGKVRKRGSKSVKSDTKDVITLVINEVRRKFMNQQQDLNKWFLKKWCTTWLSLLDL